jgi:ABC-type branched-subunit amino acid transport system permease subunit
MTAAVYLITDVLYGEPATAVVAAGLGAAFAWFWFGLPLLRRLRDRH